MRVGLFLLLSVAVHLAAGQWLDWQKTPIAFSPAGGEKARAVKLPTLVSVPTAQPLEQEAEPVEIAEVPPAPAVPEVARQKAPAVPDSATRNPPVAVKKPAEAAVKTPTATGQVQEAVVATAPQVKPQLQEPPVPIEPVEVVSRAPRFREPPAAPEYPVQARRRNQQGQVLLEVRLDMTGKQRELRLLQSSGFKSLDQAALEAVADWKFEPEVQAGQAMPSRVQIPIDFALNARR